MGKEYGIIDLEDDLYNQHLDSLTFLSVVSEI